VEEKLQACPAAHEELEEAMSAQDIAEVVNLINLYPVAVDTQTWALFDRVFTEDASTDFGGGAMFSGLASIKTVFEAIHAPFDATQHVTTNHQVSVTGDSATCLSYVHARFIRMAVAGGTMFESTGWYDDALIRTPAGWRIGTRNCRTVWSGGNPAVLQTTPDVHVETALNSLRSEARAGRLGHVAGLSGQSG
jgi:ketosteroid isomerase-like protein